LASARCTRLLLVREERIHVVDERLHFARIAALQSRSAPPWTPRSRRRMLVERRQARAHDREAGNRRHDRR
jgi:hypothetical protein